MTSQNKSRDLEGRKLSFDLLTAQGWEDYELLDSGHGQKLERFGVYRFVRQEHQALWRPALSQDLGKMPMPFLFQTGKKAVGPGRSNIRSRHPGRCHIKNCVFWHLQPTPGTWGYSPNNRPIGIGWARKSLNAAPKKLRR